MSVYNPDRFVILKIDYESEVLYKVLAGWSGGYTSGDSWKLNSGITKVEDLGEIIRFHGYSGSIYEVYKGSEGLSMATAGIYNELMDSGKVTHIKLEDFINDKI